MKTVFIKPRFNGVPLHWLYKELQKNPPSGYKILMPENSDINKFSTILSKSKSPIYKKIIYHVNALPYILYQLRDNVIVPKETDLIYAAQHIVSTEKSWIVDVELASALSGYSDLTFVKGIIARKIKQKNCKKIIAWSDWAKRTILRTFEDKSITEKIQVVRYTTAATKLEKKKEDSMIRILFMGSINVSNMLNAEYKGIYETVNSFLRLQKEFGDKIQLIIKSRIPDNIKCLIANNKGITLIEKMIPQEEVQNLYLTSDIFPHIGYETMNFSVLEAMSYGLPVIATDIFNTPELIQDNKNGFLIRPSNIDRFYTRNELPNEHSLSYLKEIRRIRSYMTDKLTEKMKLLIQDDNLRVKIGSQAKRTLEDGEFSTGNRNKLLKNIFEEAT